MQCIKTTLKHIEFISTLFSLYKHILPVLGPGPFPGIIDMFGTYGGIIESRAALLASRGFAALALPYFRYQDLPTRVTDVELEYFMARYLVNVLCDAYA